MTNPHLDVGDAFRIRWTRDNHKLEPLTWLRETRSVSDDVDLVESPDDMLCGKVVLIEHDEYTDHLFRFQQKEADVVEIAVTKFDDDIPLEKQCTEIEHKHGGVAHAEN